MKLGVILLGIVFLFACGQPYAEVNAYDIDGFRLEIQDLKLSNKESLNRFVALINGFEGDGFPRKFNNFCNQYLKSLKNIELSVRNIGAAELFDVIYESFLVDVFVLTFGLSDNARFFLAKDLYHDVLHSNQNTLLSGLGGICDDDYSQTRKSELLYHQEN